MDFFDYWYILKRIISSNFILGVKKKVEKKYERNNSLKN